MNNELGKVIKNNRIRLGMSQIDLSKITGVDPKTISLIERGVRKKPNPDTLLKLSKVLDCIDIRLFYLANYNQNDISKIIRLIEDDEYNYSFEITIKGYGKTYAGDIQEAYEHVQEDLDNQISIKNMNNDNGNVIFEKKYKVMLDFDKDI